MTNSSDHIRPGFHTVTPYLIVQDAPRLIDFLVQVFEDEEVRRDLHANGKIMNAEVRVGSSIIELAEASDAWPAQPSGLHIYLADTDAVYQRALQAGATVIYEPADMPYGERSAGIQDPTGNTWYIATYQGER